MFVTENLTDASPVASGGGRIGRDASGYAVFADDDDGAAHVAAHAMLDQGRTADGHSLLGRWLQTHRGHGA